MSERLLGLTLQEASLGAERREVEVTLIRPGLSRNKNYYGPAVFSRAVRLFEGARCFIDHHDSALRSVRDLAGLFHHPRMADDGSVRASALLTLVFVVAAQPAHGLIAFVAAFGRAVEDRVVAH